MDLHYNGFCNSVLWQLFHYIPLNLESKLSDTRTLNFQWKAHQEANRKFAEVLLAGSWSRWCVNRALVIAAHLVVAVTACINHTAEEAHQEAHLKVGPPLGSCEIAFEFGAFSIGRSRRLLQSLHVFINVVEKLIGEPAPSFQTYLHKVNIVTELRIEKNVLASGL